MNLRLRPTGTRCRSVPADCNLNRRTGIGATGPEGQLAVTVIEFGVFIAVKVYKESRCSHSQHIGLGKMPDIHVSGHIGRLKVAGNRIRFCSADIKELSAAEALRQRLCNAVLRNTDQAGIIADICIGTKEYDFFISHAWEDKETVAKPLADALIAKGAKVWLDKYAMQVGEPYLLTHCAKPEESLFFPLPVLQKGHSILFLSKIPYSISGEAVRQRDKLIEVIQQKEKDTDYKTAYQYVIEEVAYTALPAHLS